MKKTVLLSFDIEEFDMPAEYGKTIPLDEQVSISRGGTILILDILKKQQVHATFFSTVVFAQHNSDLIARIIEEGHELASHSYFHSDFRVSHLKESRLELERLSGQPVTGFRMPRIKDVSPMDIEAAGYRYNSSLNPIYLPGRYNNFFRPRTIFKERSLIQLPASATPVLRIPLFWISFHNMPLWFYQWACKRTLLRDNYLNLYFHPWEFTDLHADRLGMPSFVARNSGALMEERFRLLLNWMEKKNYRFSTVTTFLAERHLIQAFNVQRQD